MLNTINLIHTNEMMWDFYKFFSEQTFNDAFDTHMMSSSSDVK